MYPHSLMSNWSAPAIKYPEWAESPVSQPVLVHGRVARRNYAIDHHCAVAGKWGENALVLLDLDPSDLGQLSLLFCFSCGHHTLTWSDIASVYRS